MAGSKEDKDFVGILTDETVVWGERMDKYRNEGNLLMAEQALGRQLEAEWLLGVYTGKIKYPKKSPAKTKKKATGKV